MWVSGNSYDVFDNTLLDIEYYYCSKNCFHGMETSDIAGKVVAIYDVA
jgi:hypothetical protein